MHARCGVSLHGTGAGARRAENTHPLQQRPQRHISLLDRVERDTAKLLPAHGKAPVLGFACDGLGLLDSECSLVREAVAGVFTSLSSDSGSGGGLALYLTPEVVCSPLDPVIGCSKEELTQRLRGEVKC